VQSEQSIKKPITVSTLPIQTSAFFITTQLTLYCFKANTVQKQLQLYHLLIGMKLSNIYQTPNESQPVQCKYWRCLYRFFIEVNTGYNQSVTGCGSQRSWSWLRWDTYTLKCVWCSTTTTFNVYVSQRSQIQFEDEDHAVYMSFRWVTTTLSSLRTTTCDALSVPSDCKYWRCHYRFFIEMKAGVEKEKHYTAPDVAEIMTVAADY